MRALRVIHLRCGDSADTACELLRESAPRMQVWLVLPWRHPLGNSLVGLRRLWRSASDAAIDLRLVCLRPRTRALARQAGIMASAWLPFRYINQAPQGDRPQRQRSEALVHVSPLVARRLGRRPRYLGLGSAILALFLIVFLTAVLGVSAVTFVPKAEVELSPKALPVSARFKVTASPFYDEIDYGAAIIPARMVQAMIEAYARVPATGRVDVADESAIGDVVFANRTNEPVIVPKGTIVRTGSGLNVRFATIADVELPPRIYGIARVGIIALEPGTVGNVKALTINVVEGEIANQVQALNDKPTEGGTNLYHVASSC